MDPVEDFSRLDAYAAGRRRVLQAREFWKTALAGSLASLAVSAAIWVVLPRFTVRDVQVDHVVARDVPIDIPIPNVVVKNVEVDIPKIVTTAPATPEERAFTGSDGWLASTIRGRIERQDHNGFVLMTDAGEVGFYPARIGVDGKVEPNPSVEDRVEGLLGDLGYCRPLPIGTYACVALHAGQEVPIRQVPIVARAGKPT